MQQLTFVEPGTLRWTDVPDPRLESAEQALVRPLAVTTCDIDAAIIGGRVPLPGPFPLGHEFVGEVMAVGEGVTRVRPGTRVIVPFQINCGRCDRCVRGLTNVCRAVPFRSAYGLGPIGGTGWGGAFADLVRVPFAEAMLEPLPDGVHPTAAASASDNMPDAWRTVGPPLRETPGADVLIVGGTAHSIALYAAGMAVALGASRVDFVDTDPGRLALAARLGARPIEGPPPRRAGEYPITVDCSADPAGLACALRSTSPYGTCTSVGIYFEDVAMPLLEMYTRGIRFVTGRVNARAHLGDVLALIRGGAFRPELVNSAIIPWTDVVDGLLAAPMKPVFVRDPVWSGAKGVGAPA